MNVGRLSPEHITIDKWHIRACLCGVEEGKVDCSESITIKTVQESRTNHL